MTIDGPLTKWNFPTIGPETVAKSCCEILSFAMKILLYFTLLLHFFNLNELVTGRKRPQNTALLTSARGRSSTSAYGSYDCAQMKTYIFSREG
ncbi:hypothetical protein T10_3059 [Trichinella papuae]|uniref:Uncharacterized protein n=1 Tax=Trichinella papuae TaxID=268474 RepID=A0A0V1MT24_9BILA|nr:hypothetical protein T10_3059 [Trichinella papuae]